MTFPFDSFFQALFNTNVPRIIVKADVPLFTIVLNNEAHKVATNLVGKDITGKSIWEVFNPQEAGGDGGDLLMSALTKAQDTCQTVLMPTFRYDMVSADQTENELRWWQLEIIPVCLKNGKAEYLIATTLDVTENVLKQQILERAQSREALLNEELAATNEELAATNEELAATNEELAATNEELQVSQEELLKLNNSLEETVEFRTFELVASEAKFRTLVEQSPVAIALLDGKDYILNAANAEMLKVWGKNSDIVGKPIIKALPEMEGQAYPGILAEVFATGVPYFGNEAEVSLVRNGHKQTAYFNFINHPLLNPQGKVDSVIVVANEITQQVLARRKTEENESNLHTLIMTARYPLMILRGEEWVVEIANQGIADLWAKPLNEILGRKLLDIIPVIEGQPFPALLRQVFETGLGYAQEEEEFHLDLPDGKKTKYISFNYDPIFEGKIVSGIIVTAHDITEFVSARKKLERVFEQSRLSKEAAQLGLFDLDLVKGTMEWDVRCRELFGIAHADEVTYNNDFLPGLHPDDKERISKIISDLFDKKGSNGNYDVEYRTIGALDGVIRWVRAKGKVFFDETDRPVRFIGSVLDITDKKMEEQRKNDFIGMVSHELKTPLTSLKANVQMLHFRARKANDDFAVSAFSQAEKQINKMTSMINGFLNVSRLESGSLHLHNSRFDINRLITDVVTEIKISVSTHSFDFSPSTEMLITADEDKISHVLSNLISNAVKYSSEGKHIYVTTHTNSANVVVSIKDEGIGIKDMDLEKLFSRYYRVEEVNTKYISGFGIGLYLCAEIIRLHKGNIWVESEPGEGSTFTFTLPYN